VKGNTTWEPKDKLIADGYADEIAIFNKSKYKEQPYMAPLYSSQKIREMKDKGVFLGLAQVIHNATTDVPHTKFTNVFGLQGVHVLENSTAVLKKIVLLEDSHTKIHGEAKDSKSSLDFIRDQIRTATGFVDLFLEVPYINKEEKHLDDIMNFSGSIGWTAEDTKACFATTEERRKQLIKNIEYPECKYLNLRAHYIDQRKNKAFSGSYAVYTNVYDAVSDKLKDKDNYGINDVIKTLKSPEGRAVFENPASVAKMIKEQIHNSKLGKQIRMIKDKKIRDTVQSFADKWTDMDYVAEEAKKRGDPFDYKKVFNVDFLISVLTDNVDTDLAWYTMVRYNTIIMDIYTIARIFRSYADTKGENSNPATHVIILAGNAHTERYQDVFDTLGYSLEFTTKGEEFVVNITDLKQPVFKNV
jgi:hypothetical protein